MRSYEIIIQCFRFKNIGWAEGEGEGEGRGCKKVEKLEEPLKVPVPDSRTQREIKEFPPGNEEQRGVTPSS